MKNGRALAQPIFRFKNIKFDEYTVKSQSNIKTPSWSQICSSCRKQRGLEMFADVNLAGDTNSLCGIESCKNRADYFINF